jgi:hypothetical protein
MTIQWDNVSPAIPLLIKENTKERKPEKNSRVGFHVFVISAFRDLIAAKRDICIMSGHGAGIKASQTERGFIIPLKLFLGLKIFLARNLYQFYIKPAHASIRKLLPIKQLQNLIAASLN